MCRTYISRSGITVTLLEFSGDGYVDPVGVIFSSRPLAVQHEVTVGARKIVSKRRLGRVRWPCVVSGLQL